MSGSNGNRNESDSNCVDLDRNDANSFGNNQNGRGAGYDKHAENSMNVGEVEPVKNGSGGHHREAANNGYSEDSDSSYNQSNLYLKNGFVLNKIGCYFEVKHTWI